MNNDDRTMRLIRGACKDINWCMLIASTKAEELQGNLMELTKESTQEDVLAIAMGAEVWTMAELECEEREAAREDLKWEQAERKLSNRALYLPTINMEAKARRDGTVYWRFTDSLDSAGLAARILEHLGVDTTQPVQMNVFNRLPMVLDENGKPTGEQYAVPQSEIDNMWEQGYLYSGGKTIWNLNIPELKAMLCEAVPGLNIKPAFPVAIDNGSYNRRYGAPLVHGGFLPAMRIRVHHLTVNVNGVAVDQGVDGSGVYDPFHPDLAELMERYGPVGLQGTMSHLATGTACKGMWYPREGINDGLPEEEQCGFHCDHLQVKGYMKDSHKDLLEVAKGIDSPCAVILEDVYIGIMKAKTTSGRVSSCFETLEQIGPVGPYKDLDDYLGQRRAAREIITEFTNEAMDRIAKLGPEGLLGRACRDDAQLRRLADFLIAANAQGAGINPMDIPMIKGKIEESLSKTLWGPTNGAGMAGKYPIVCIDNTLKPGTCVIAGQTIGRSLAVWRFPTILAQGLAVLKVVEPSAHHQVQGVTTPHVIFMHTDDIVTKHQGDDDGDEVGFSADPRLIKLFHMRKDKNTYHIEPAGEKLPYLTLSEEGREYIGKDPTGPIGFLTIWKAGLGAVGANKMELAFAVGCQEAIDSQKRWVRPTDPYKAAEISNWYQDERGEYHIHYKIDGEYVTDNFMSEKAGEFPLEVYADANAAALIANNCSRMSADGEIEAGWPLGWRIQKRIEEDEEGNLRKKKLRKAVAFSNWQSATTKQDGDGTNWVHHAHDVAMYRWEELQEGWTSESTVVARDLLPQILKNMGRPMKPTQMSWEQYQNTIREQSGIVKYGAGMSKVSKNNDMSPQQRLGEIDMLRATLDNKMAEMTAQDLLDIWWMELNETWWYFDKARKCRVYVATKEDVPGRYKGYRANKPNYAFTAVANKRSAIMQLLGFDIGTTCTYLVDRVEDLDKRIVGWCFAGPNPYSRFTKIIRADTGHAAVKVDDNGEGLHLGECKDCMSTLRTVLVRRVRDAKTAAEIDVAKKLCTTLNKMEHEILPGWEIKFDVVYTDGEVPDASDIGGEQW